MACLLRRLFRLSVLGFSFFFGINRKSFNFRKNKLEIEEGGGVGPRDSLLAPPRASSNRLSRL